MIKKITIGSIALILIIPSVLFFVMKVSPVSWNLLGPINQDNGIALRGNDPVAYVNEGSVVKGNPNIGLKQNDVIYRFSSEENKLMFKTFPEKFTPQYGGYCAYAISAGYTADSDPQIWEVIDDKLYLFFDNGAKDKFKQQIDDNIALADSAWSQR